MKSIHYALSVLAAGILLVPTAVATAQVPGFGGPIVTSVICTCSPGTLWITLGPPRPGSYIYQAGVTRLSAHWLLFPPASLKGRTFPAVVPCMIIVPTGCIPIGAGLLISETGTTLI